MTKGGRRWLRFGRFNLVGLLGAGLQVGLLCVLTERFRLPLFAAIPVAVELVVLHNFVWHETFTWRDRRFKTVQQRAIALLLFHAGNGCISLIGNTILTYLLVERLRAPLFPSACAAIAVCSVLNFFLADRWVFSASRERQGVAVLQGRAEARVK
ncbi:MAG: GtrA family protein [Bryobacteraceae bacterium]